MLSTAFGKLKQMPMHSILYSLVPHYKDRFGEYLDFPKYLIPITEIKFQYKSWWFYLNCIASA